MSQVNITLNTNTVDVNTTNNQIVVTDPTNPTTVNVVQPITTVVEVITAGPQGPPGSATNTGGLLTTASFNAYTGSSSSQFAGTSSFASTASYALNANVNTGSFVTTSSFNAFTSSYNTGSFTGSFTGSLFGTSSWAVSASNAQTASYVLQAVSASFAISSSLAQTASYVQNAQTASYVLQAISSSFASTASFAQGGNGPFSGSFSGSGANLNSIPTTAIVGNFTQIATGSVTASVTPTQFSVVSGSMTEFLVTGTGATLGGAITDTHRVTGSLTITGSNIVIGNQTITGSLIVSSSNATQFLVGNNTLFANSAGNVGIGTTSPTNTLEILSNITASLRIFGTGSSQILVVRANTLSRTGFIRYPSNYQIGTAGSDPLQFLTDNAVRMHINDTTGFVGIGTTSPTAKLEVNGPVIITVSASAASTIPLQITSGSTSLLFVSSSGRVGIGTTTPSSSLDVSGSARITNGLTVTSSLVVNGTSTLSNGQTTIQGSSATTGNALVVSNSTPINLLTVQNNGQVISNTPTVVLAASQSAFIVSQSISQSAVVGASVYGLNLVPTFLQTTGSQNQTAFRVAPTFLTSSAAATSGSNIIADFSSLGTGTQFTVNDITSGSIYLVNDVSGLPIIEATSNWDVNIYDYPTKVLQKTGSQIIINGTLKATGSFILPLSQSTSPQLGSAYWSGSFLFVHNGTRYMSASFF